MSRYEVASEAVIEKAMQGDVEAFNELYRMHAERVYFMCIQYFKNEELAKDVVQEVFIKVYKNIHTLKEPKAFSSWLYMVTYRQCQNEKRKKNLVFELGDDEKIEDFPDTYSEDITSLVANKHMKEVIMESLDSMHESLRIVGILRFFEELKIEEITDILGISSNTVKSRLFRIKKKLQKDLLQEGISVEQSSVMISPVLIHEMYQLLSTKYGMSEGIKETVLHNVLHKGSKIKLTTKLVWGSMVILAIVVGLIFYNQPNKNIGLSFHLEMPEMKIEEQAKITDITYTTSWQNTAININVITTNERYDKILINGVETLQVQENGSYTVSLIKNDMILDERSITISNIDTIMPIATSEKTSTKYTLYVIDKQSGINWNSIKHYKNGIVVNDISYDTINNTITIENDFYVSTHEIYISDYAGNTICIQIS